MAHVHAKAGGPTFSFLTALAPLTLCQDAHAANRCCHRSRHNSKHASGHNTRIRSERALVCPHASWFHPPTFSCTGGGRAVCWRLLHKKCTAAFFACIHPFVHGQWHTPDCHAAVVGLAYKTHKNECKRRHWVTGGTGGTCASSTTGLTVSGVCCWTVCWAITASMSSVSDTILAAAPDPSLLPNTPRHARTLVHLCGFFYAAGL